MPLTPAEVHNVAFKKPPIGKRGYDEDEVDAFLDDVEHELARLIEENSDLREQAERVRAGRPSPAAAGAGTAGAPKRDEAQVRENADLKSHIERLEQQLRRAEQARQDAEKQARENGGPARPQTPRSAPAGQGSSHVEADAGDDRLASDGEQALSVLMTAQRTANEHVSGARRKAEQMLSEARSKAEEVSLSSQGKAEALEKDARQRHQDAMGGLEVKRAALQKHIEELKAFEREYRSRLKAYLEGQLRDLAGKGQSLDSELVGEGGPASSAAVGATPRGGSSGNGSSGNGSSGSGSSGDSSSGDDGTPGEREDPAT